MIFTLLILKIYATFRLIDDESPVPLNVTIILGVSASSDVIVRVESNVPFDDGVNVTVMVQLPLAEIVIEFSPQGFRPPPVSRK